MKKPLLLLGLLILVISCTPTKDTTTSDSQDTTIEYQDDMVDSKVTISADNSQPSDDESMPSLGDDAEMIIASVMTNPDANLESCDTITDSEAQQVCYQAYFAAKVEKGESIDATVCDKFTEEQVTNGCKLYVTATTG